MRKLLTSDVRMTNGNASGRMETARAVLLLGHWYTAHIVEQA